MPSVSIQRMHIVLLLIPWLLVLTWSASGLTSCGEQAVRPPVVANEPTQGAIDECVNREMESQRIPGLSLAVVRAGKLFQAKGYGKASLELDAPATASTLYGLGSISKQFTATAIMLLVEAGKLNLDDRLTNCQRCYLLR